MVTFQENKLLKELSTFKIGGPARYFYEAHSSEEMCEALSQAKKNHLSFLVIGKGSNCLFDDRGFDGLIILNKIDFFKQPEVGLFHVGAGYSFSLLGAQTAKLGLKGLEFASGIPGSVGGAVYMNAGANGGDVSQVVTEVDYISEEGERVSYLAKDLAFSYRTSLFQKMRGAIVSVFFKLQNCSESRKKQLELINYRKKTQPYGEPSVGCVFRNPPGYHAGALIEKAGLKGFSCGDAKISFLHANFIVNSGHANAIDVLNLINQVREIVARSTGVNLECEVKIIPYRLDK